jgi:hypothetical protein
MNSSFCRGEWFNECLEEIADWLAFGSRNREGADVADCARLQLFGA